MEDKLLEFFWSLDIDSIHSLFLFPSAIDVCNGIPIKSFPNVEMGVAHTGNIGIQFNLVH